MVIYSPASEEADNCPLDHPFLSLPEDQQVKMIMKKEQDDATLIMRTSHHIQGEDPEASAKRSPLKKPPIPK